MARLGRYRLGRVLGDGGSGTVYDALLVGPGGFRKPVALKVLRSGGESIRREARIGGLLRHRNLVDVYEIGEDDGTWFCAMERCDGTISDHLPLPPRAVVEVGVAICEALAYAQDALGLIHLDLKPANVLLAGGVVKLADLGIARAEGFELDEARTRAVRGTRGYMAPEQAEGRDVDARADVYALGVTLIELATGHRPVISGTLDLAWLDEPTLAEGRTAPPAPPEPPDWLAPVVERCLAPSPDERWPDMAALAAALQGLEVDGPGLDSVIGRPDDSDVPDDVTVDAPVHGFVGRERERAELVELLAEPGCVAIRGPAGVGKSRLAAVVGTSEGATVVDLADAESRRGTLNRIGRALNVFGGPDEPLDVEIGRAIAARERPLLVLDNIDRTEGLGALLDGWTRAAPQARFLLTGRAAPDSVRRVLDLGPLEPESAVRLLVDRAGSRGVEIADLEAARSLATRLDGLPLALELAAGRLGVLSIPDILDRFDLSVFRSGEDDRHGTLDAALEWSRNLLDPPDQAALAQLSVFRGGFELEQAEEVVRGVGSLVERIETLVTRSMVSATAGGRFALLECVRAHAARGLDDPLALERRHGEVYAAIARARTEGLGPDVDNFVAACRRAVARGDEPVAKATLFACWRCIERTGPYSMAAELCEAVLEMPGLSPDGIGVAHNAAGQVAYRAGRLDLAISHMRASMEAFAACADEVGEARAMGNLALFLRDRGRMDEALPMMTRALEIQRRLGVDRHVAITLSNVATALHTQGRLREALPLLREAHALHRAVGNRTSEARSMANLGRLLGDLGEHDEALERLEGALALHRELGSRSGEGSTLGSLANELHATGRSAEALEVYAEALAVQRETGNPSCEAMTLAQLGELHLAEERPDEARECFERAADLGREIGYERLEAFALGSLAAIDSEGGRFERAAARFSRSIEILERVRDDGSLTVVLARFADHQRALGDLDAARATLDTARAMAPPGFQSAHDLIAQIRAAIDDA